MVSYPIELEDDDGTVMAASPDFPELTTFGEDRTEALARAVDALEEAISARIHGGQGIPAPSRGRTLVGLPTLTAVKVILYQEMKGTYIDGLTALPLSLIQAVRAAFAPHGSGTGPGR